MSKISKKEAHYRKGGTKNHRCHDCAHIQLNGELMATCTKVTGPVKRNDVCDYFEKKSER
jgi:hypothetical protein